MPDVEEQAVDQDRGNDASDKDQRLEVAASEKTKVQENSVKNTGEVFYVTETRWPHPLVELTLVRVREFIREPEAVFWVLVFPVLLTCALGIAFRNAAPEKVQVAIEATEAASSRTKLLIDAIRNSPDIEATRVSRAEADEKLRSGQVALVVRAETLADNPNFVFTYRFDSTRPESRAAHLIVDNHLQRAFGRQDAVPSRDEAVTGPGARYIDFLVPGLVGLNLMGSGMWGLGFAVVQARTRKLLKRFAATPMRRHNYLVAFMLSRLVFLALEVAAIIGFAWFAFGVAVRGSIWSLVVVLLLGGVTFAGLGLLVAARPRTIEGVSGLMNLVMLPMWVASGTFFSATRFPDFLQPFIQALPLTALNDALRNVMNNGDTLQSNWPELGVLLAWSAISFILALRLFRWQ